MTQHHDRVPPMRIGLTLLALLVAQSLQAQPIGMAGTWQTLPDIPPAPADNALNAERAALGARLYQDKRLSSDGTVSCENCHGLSSGGGTDNQPTATGVHGQHGGRSAPTTWNSGFYSVQFWDGRANTLEEQAAGPMTNPVEMGNATTDAAASHISGDSTYQAAFAKAYPGRPINGQTVTQAIASFERTLVTNTSPYDRYVKGDASALNTQQQRGMNTFAEVGCASCHGGPNFSGPTAPTLAFGDGFYQKIGIFEDTDLLQQYHLHEDTGRAEQTQNAQDNYLFKVPTLRNIALTAPYFHKGQVADLPTAVDLMAKLQLNRKLSAEQITDIVAFLQTLTGSLPPTALQALQTAQQH